MNSDLQTVLALIVVAVATGYLALTWWRQRSKPSAGCGTSGGCSCPAPRAHLGKR
ncbi:hypothetical protein PXH66_19425 [Synoicihabitans lomoniglobus]|uniref:FeoB-associated Cys-rich membrane protein n=1 Tax=Synoicihabitans lomoniglobus TaxID=2909285 RepID=A0AAF0CHN7_9BACT|nr:hypothetical protein PXH66_19425 [Opitutaceae bacterium LMO-M01]